MTASMACFVGGDALVKLAGQSIPMSQVIFVRSICGVILLLGLGVVLRTPHFGRALSDRRVLARIALDTGATVGFLTALVHMPLASATAINQATPIIITAIAMLVLKESVNTRKWLTILAGFVGVLLVDDRQISALQIVLASTVCLIPISAIWGLADDWQVLSAVDVLVLTFAAVFVSAAYILITYAIREGTVAVIVPFRYTALIFAAILGWAIWGDLPNTLAWFGIAVIVMTGTYLLRSR